MNRCRWCNPNNPLYIAYHDTEWGRPVHDDRKLFEFLILESFQAGLSWETILKKREHFRRAFDDFDPEIICRYDQMKVQELMSDPGIVRNRRKIEAAIVNASVFLSDSVLFRNVFDIVSEEESNNAQIQDNSFENKQEISDDTENH